MLELTPDFIKEYAPRYGYKYIGIEDNLMLQKRLNFNGTNNRQGNYTTVLV